MLPEGVDVSVAVARGEPLTDGVKVALGVTDELSVPTCDGEREVVALCVAVPEGLCVADMVGA